MTPVEDVRARLERMIELVKALRYAEAGYSERGIDSEYVAFIEAANPDRLLRVAQQALHTLNRHSPYASDPDVCSECESEDSQPVRWPCVEVASVLRAWQP